MTFSATALASITLLLFALGVLTGAVAVRVGTPTRRDGGRGAGARDDLAEVVKLLIEKVVRELRHQASEADEQALPRLRRKWLGRR